MGALCSPHNSKRIASPKRHASKKHPATKSFQAIRIFLTLDGLETKIKVKDGGLFFQAGRKHGNGVLVLAIEAKSTNS